MASPAAGLLRKPGFASSVTLALGLAVLAVLAIVLPALSPAASNETQGAALLQAVDSGRRDCGQLIPADFRRIGEFVMGRMAGSLRAHDAMETQMRRMMGPGAEQRVHVFLGQRFSGCGGVALPARFAGMMGAIGLTMGGMMGSSGSGATNVPGYGMMGGSARGGGSIGTDDDEGPSAAAMVGMMAVLIGAVALAVLLLRPKRSLSGPQEVLEQRFARGELSADEYRQSKQLLEGE